MKIGFTGVPPLEIINEHKCRYPHAEWLDLDVPVKDIHRSIAADHIPETTCSIIQTILANTEIKRPDILIASVGKGKCDQMSLLIPIIRRISPDTRIIETENRNIKSNGIVVSTSDLPLKEKFNLITNSVISRAKDKTYSQCSPKAGFWGVPPYDFSILDLFPDQTHVYGWTRCMENGTPDNMEMELYTDINVPTVFYSQAFCSKNILAKELAKRNKGLYVEADGTIDNSTKEKIKAFLELKHCF